MTSVQWGTNHPLICRCTWNNPPDATPGLPKIGRPREGRQTDLTYSVNNQNLDVHGVPLKRERQIQTLSDRACRWTDRRTDKNTRKKIIISREVNCNHSDPRQVFGKCARDQQIYYSIVPEIMIWRVMVVCKPRSRNNEEQNPNRTRYSS